MKRNDYLRGGLWIVGTLLACTGCGSKIAPAAAVDATVDDLVTVKIVVPERLTLKRTTTQPATIHAYHQAEIYSKVAGYLKSLQVDIGQPVQTNAVLGVIDIPEMKKGLERQEARIQQLTADENSAQANVALEKANVQAAEAARDQAQADITKTEAQLTADRSEFNRVQELVANKSIAARLLDEARKKLESSQAAKTSSEAAFASSKANVLVAMAKLAVAFAGGDAAKAATNVARKALEEMDALMGYATLKAPFKGVVIERHVDPGDLVRNIQTASNTEGHPLFTIAQLDKVRVRVAVPENDAPWANVGDTVSLRMRAISGRTFEGTISRVAGALDESTRTMLIEVDLPNAERLLLPGMYGEATIVLEEKANALMLPAGAVRYDESGKSYVYVVNEENIVRIVEVTTGSDDGKQIEITGELDENAAVVDAMLGRLQTDQHVHVQVEGK